MGVGLGTAALLVGYNVVTNLRDGKVHWYLARNAASAVALVVVARRRGLSWRQLGLAHTDLRAGWRQGRRVAGATAVTVVAAGTVGQRRELGRRVLADRRADLGPRQLAFQTLVRIPLGTAAFEELAFRGVLFGVLSATAGRRAALVGSSAAFGLWHVGPTLAALRCNDVREGRARLTAAAVGLTALAGTGFGVLRLSSGHVVACGLAHWAINAVGLVLAARSQRPLRMKPRPGRTLAE